MSPVRSRFVLLLGALLAAAGGCRRGVKAPLVPVDHAAIYAGVLAELLPDSIPAAVVLDSLLPAMDIDDAMVPGVVGQLQVRRQSVDAFRAAQRRGGVISAPMLPDARWWTVSSVTLDSLRRLARAEAGGGPTSPRSDAFWQQFRRHFPHAAGYVVLSPAWMSDDGREALVYVQRACGALCGEGELRLLRRAADGAWHTVSRMLIAIS